MVKKKSHKSTLGQNQKKEGKQHIYILLSMIIAGLLLAFYNLNN